MSNDLAVENRSTSATRVADAIASASLRTGVKFSYLFNKARIESGLNPSAQARTSSATGLFQFTRQTWMATVKQHGTEHGLGWAADVIARRADGRYVITDPALQDAVLKLRNDPVAASGMAAELASDNSSYLRSRLGRVPEDVDLYLAHFLGAADAARFLSKMETNPDAAAAPFFPRAAEANRSIFYDRDGTARSLSDIRQRFSAKLNSKPAPEQFAGALPALPALPVQLASRETRPTDFPQIRPIEKMPHRLSLDFARLAYQRLASMAGEDPA